MAEKVKVRFDPEGDFLEVLFRDAPGYMRATTNDALRQRGTFGQRVKSGVE